MFTKSTQWRFRLISLCIACILAVQPLLLLPRLTEAAPAVQRQPGCSASSLGGQIVPNGQTTRAGKYQQHVVCDPTGRTNSWVHDQGRDWPCVDCTGNIAPPTSGLRATGPTTNTQPSVGSPHPNGGVWGWDPNTYHLRQCSSISGTGYCREVCPQGEYPNRGNCYDNVTGKLMGDSISGQRFAPPRYSPESPKPPTGCITATHKRDGVVIVQATRMGWMRCDRPGSLPWFHAHSELSGVERYPDPADYYRSQGGGTEAVDAANKNARSTLEELGLYIGQKLGTNVEGKEFEVGAATAVGLTAGTYVAVRIAVPIGKTLVTNAGHYVVAAVAANAVGLTATAVGIVVIAGVTYTVYRLYKIYTTREQPKRTDCSWWDRLLLSPGCE